jgi:hypothetical protein
MLISQNQNMGRHIKKNKINKNVCSLNMYDMCQEFCNSVVLFVVLRAGPPNKQVKHLLEAPKKFFKKKLTAKKKKKKGPKFKKKKIPTGSNLKEFWNKEKRKKKKKNR